MQQTSMHTIKGHRFATAFARLPVILVGVLVGVFVGVGCASTPATPPEPVEEPVPVVQKKQPAPAVVRQMVPKLDPVYFGTDDAKLPSKALDVLQRYATSMIEHPEWGVVTIDGHCDERGGDEYNQTLGRSRAAAVERYLVKAGLPSSRIATRSFGSARPAALGHDESAWKYNRRSEIHVEALSAASR